MGKTRLIFSILSVLLLILGSTDVYAQLPRKARKTEKKIYGTLTIREKEAPDSITLARIDSLHKADSVHRADSASLLEKSSLDKPAFTTAKDSIVEIFENGHRKIFYYGDVSVTYQDIKLTAEYMEYDMTRSEVFAKGIYDSIAGEWKGLPVMTQNGSTYNMEEVTYNFDTKRAKIKNMDTQTDDGLVHGKSIKMFEDNSINMTGGRYTVCDAEHPHYYMNLTMAKVITKPSQKTVFGPAYLVVEDVKLPFVALPFGFIPKRPDRATGLLMPTFGEEEARGFYLRDMGMYFVFGDYLDLSVTGDYYTLGSWAVDINSRYLVKYKFTGNFSFNYSHDQKGEKGSPDFFSTSNFGLRWTHQQDSKSIPGMTFSASVNFSSPSNSRYNSHSVTEALQNQTQSSISFSKNWNGKFNFSINATHNQNSRDSSYNITFPNITFSMSTIYPFKKKNRVGKEKFYEKISIGYNTSLQNSINFKASEFNIKDPAFINKMNNSMNHNFSLGLPAFQLFKYLNFTPGISYGMNWYFRDYNAVYDEDKKSVSTQKGDMFGAFGIVQRGSASLSMSTRLYGMFNFGTFHKIQAIRHVISPSVGLSYTPDMSGTWNGYTNYIYTDSQGEQKTYTYNRFTGSSGAGQRQSATASISIGNNLEAKVRDFADTTGKGTKKVKLIDQFNIGTNYDFMKDSLNMATVSMNLTTTLFNKVSISSSLGFDPYAVDKHGTKINKFALGQGQGLLRFTNVSASASYTLSGQGTIKGDDGQTGGGGNAASYYQRVYYHPVTGEYIPGGWLYYTNPNVPWSVNLSANFSLSKSYSYDRELDRLQTNNRITATLQASGNLRISPKMNMSVSTGYDFVAKNISTTQFSFTYDLHCFNISVQWVPLGTYKSYSFRIAANASALQDLLQFRKSNSYWDNF